MVQDRAIGTMAVWLSGNALASINGT